MSETMRIKDLKIQMLAGKSLNLFLNQRYMVTTTLVKFFDFIFIIFEKKSEKNLRVNDPFHYFLKREISVLELAPILS